MPENVTVTLPKAEFNEIVNLLQLMAVVGIDLYVDGPQPDKKLLLSAFDIMFRASFSNTEPPK